MHPKNDRFLVWARDHYGWEIEQMGGLDAGELALFVGFFVNDRFVISEKPTYAYEIAWVFRRDRGTIGKVLRNLEDEGTVVKTASRRKGVTFFLPKPENIDSESKSSKSGRNQDSDDWFKKVS